MHEPSSPAPQLQKARLPPTRPGAWVSGGISWEGGSMRTFSTAGSRSGRGQQGWARGCGAGRGGTLSPRRWAGRRTAGSARGCSSLWGPEPCTPVPLLSHPGWQPHDRNVPLVNSCMSSLLPVPDPGSPTCSQPQIPPGSSLHPLWPRTVHLSPCPPPCATGPGWPVLCLSPAPCPASHLPVPLDSAASQLCSC